MEFVMTARLGRGATAETFTGVLHKDGSRLDIVVKHPRPELESDESFGDAFVSWGRAQRDIEHSNIVSVLGAGRKAGRPFVVQERVFGASLAQVLEQLRKRKRTLKPELAFNIAHQIIGALEHVQTTLEGPHEGIDPSEVILGYHGEVKIGDQRLHAIDRLAGDDFRQSATYLAPEVDRGDDATNASDVYSFALVTPEMLIGHAVWLSPSMTVDAAVQALRDFSHVGQSKPGLTDDLVTVLGMCVEDDVATRFGNAATVHTEWKRIAKKNRIAPDPEALGAFVRRLLPKQAADEAPTMLVTTHNEAEQDIESAAEFRDASVMIDPELQQKALRRVSSPGTDTLPPGVTRERKEEIYENSPDDTVDPAEFASTRKKPNRPRRQRSVPTDPLAGQIPGGTKGAWALFVVFGLMIIVLLAVLVSRSS